MRYFKTAAPEILTEYNLLCDRIGAYTTAAREFSDKVKALAPYMIYYRTRCHGFIFLHKPRKGWKLVDNGMLGGRLYQFDRTTEEGDRLYRAFNAKVNINRPQGSTLCRLLGYDEPGMHCMLWSDRLDKIIRHHGYLYFEVQEHRAYTPPPSVIEVLGSEFEEAFRQDKADEEAFLSPV